MWRPWIILFLLTSCTVPQAPSDLFSQYRTPAQQGCHLKRHHSANVYRSFNGEKALDDVWYDNSYALEKLEEHKKAGKCD